MGYLPHVKKGDALSARKENAKIDAINALSDRLDTLWKGGGAAGGLRVTIENPGNTPVMTGQPLAVTGCRASGSFDKLKSLWMGGSIPLAGAALAANSEMVAYALEGIPGGSIGKAYCQEALAAVATLAAANHKFIKPGAGGMTTTDNGRFKILAKSEADSGKVFCFVYALDTGHRVCQTSGWDGTSKGDNWTANVTIAGETVPVKCPLLRSGESIGNGTTVIVSWNGAANAWQVIEAQCPAEGS